MFLSLGGNQGDPERAIAASLRTLDDDPDTEVVAASSPYKTPPWGKLDQPDFLNIAAELRTRREPRDLLALCLGVERRQHRVRGERWGPRSIDIDIVAFGTREIHEDGLVIPHPRLAERAFVLVPLAEIAPDALIAGRSVSDLVREVRRDGIVRLERPDRWWV